MSERVFYFIIIRRFALTAFCIPFEFVIEVFEANESPLLVLLERSHCFDFNRIKLFFFCIVHLCVCVCVIVFVHAYDYYNVWKCLTRLHRAKKYEPPRIQLSNQSKAILSFMMSGEIKQFRNRFGLYFINTWCFNFVLLWFERTFNCKDDLFICFI